MADYPARKCTLQKYGKFILKLLRVGSLVYAHGFSTYSLHSFSLVLAGNNQPADGILLFGGEYFDGSVSKCFNETIRLRVLATTPEWKQVSSPNSPPPRCAHCTAATPTHAYVFGGEFSTAYKFHHYNDLWRFDFKTNQVL
jgi:hypothetical protein